MYRLMIKEGRNDLFLTPYFTAFMPEMDMNFAEFYTVNEALQEARQQLTNDIPKIFIVNADNEVQLSVTL